MDETTPHIHATVVPIVTGERRKAQAEREQAEATGKKQYRTKNPNAPRLCADDIMSRAKLEEYQTSYAEAMSKYGLQRGIKGSEAKHIPTSQFYKEVWTQQDTVARNVEQLRDEEQNLTENITVLSTQSDAIQKVYSSVSDDVMKKKKELEELERKRQDQQKEITSKKTKFKSKALDAATAAADTLSSVLSDNKVKRYEQQIDDLKNEIKELKQEYQHGNAQHQTEIEQMQEEINTQIESKAELLLDKHKEIEALKDEHNTEQSALKDHYKQEINALQTKLDSIDSYFPFLKNFMEVAEYAKTLGFTDNLIRQLSGMQSVPVKGTVLSPEHNSRFEINNLHVQICPHPENPHKFFLSFDGTDAKEWLEQKHLAEQHRKAKEQIKDDYIAKTATTTKQDAETTKNKHTETPTQIEQKQEVKQPNFKRGRGM